MKPIFTVIFLVLATQQKGALKSRSAFRLGLGYEGNTRSIAHLMFTATHVYMYVLRRHVYVHLFLKCQF